MNRLAQFGRILLISVICWGWGTAADADQPGPKLVYDFSAGAGSLVTDRSGHGHQATIHGAQWVRSHDRNCLRFDGDDDYLDGGPFPALDGATALTLEAWVQPELGPRGTEMGLVGKSYGSFLLTYYTAGTCYFYRGSALNHITAPMEADQWHHVVATYDGSTMVIYVNGVKAKSEEFENAAPATGGRLLLGAVPLDEKEAERFDDRKDKHTEGKGYFKGMLGTVRIYRRAISAREVALAYKAEAGFFGRDTSSFDRFVLTSYSYPDQEKIFLDLDARGFFPLMTDARIDLALLDSGGEVLQEKVITPLPDSGQLREVDLSMKGRAAGGYRLQAQLHDASGSRPSSEFPLDYASPRVEFPSPDQRVAPMLPKPWQPPKFSIEIAKQGGFTVKVAGHRFGVESTYSFPHGGENQFSVTDAPAAVGERPWRVTVEKIDGENYRITGRGAFYEIQRHLQLQDGRVLVRDTIENLTNEPLGIMLNNRLGFDPEQGFRGEAMENPTVLISGDGAGVGMIALDDVYQVQLSNYVAKTNVAKTNVAKTDAAKTDAGKAEVGIRDNRFGLAAGASYTLEWAVYPNDTGNLWDFVNQVRQDEVVTRTVEGGWAARFDWLRRILLAPTLTALGDPWLCKDERSTIDDIYAKIQHGALYFYYGSEDVRLTHQNITEHMYPITTERIDPGIIRGRERIITCQSGVYGWQDNSNLHGVHQYDGRGAPTMANTLTTADSSGVRTELTLGERHTAAIVRLPISLVCDSPVNVHCQQYDGAAIHLMLTGDSNVVVTIRDGDFALEPNSTYDLQIGAQQRREVRSSGDAVVAFSTELSSDGPTEIRLKILLAKK